MTTPTPEPTQPKKANPNADPGHPQGKALTTSQGTPLKDTDHSLKAGPRGPVLLQDHHLREKITHFDHERIPERVVHARGAGAHGIFTSYGTGSKICSAEFLAEGASTPVFVRFSTVAGSRGSADTVRDTRGFATKFYTGQGVFDLVGNNIPVFFIQDGIKFPDVVHAVKPHPDLEIPQAQSAHDTFWDFVSLHTQAQAHTMWFMADRGIPRSFRMMEGFGVHTFRMTGPDGSTSLVKFHWKPKLGVHSLVWEEAMLTNGADPDFHRRDLSEAIKAGAFPEWELGLQVFEDNEEQMFKGIDLLDPTKFVPEELAPVTMVGKMVLDRNPSNYFAETEQVAFHPGHLVPGIDVTNDPLLQGRLFSYIDTQLTRLGGPNFSQLPINLPHAPVNDMLRDGMHQTYIHEGIAPYHPNSLDGGCPFMAGEGGNMELPFIDFPERVAESVKERANPVSFDDHYSQARMFYRSLATVEQLHVQQAYAFELGKCASETVRARQVQALANIDAQLCAAVAGELGLPVPEADTEVPDAALCPSVSQLGGSWPVEGRVVGIVASHSTDAAVIERLVADANLAGMRPLLVAPVGGTLADGSPVDRTLLTARSIEFDALVIADVLSPSDGARVDRDTKAGAPTPEGGKDLDPRFVLLLQEAYRQSKAIVALDGVGLRFPDAGIPAESAGVLPAGVEEAVELVAALLASHRVWARFDSPTS
ncbi:catalase [Paeniglutamicibacter gangotriensis]|uniref:Catalase n=1 Tax=Paeniglutamicibacter gangotriensis TaxID=254787 RepID=A0A5B0EHT8_9MICC|nr:catalase [Paeniglutamicibacter gangotriensis]KAA0978604.1 catalase [Paeniglutamicibacter gangotriensis]